jgi:hypothetical protein
MDQEIVEKMPASHRGPPLSTALPKRRSSFVRHFAEKSGGCQSPVALVKATTAAEELDPHRAAAGLALENCDFFRGEAVSGRMSGTGCGRSSRADSKPWYASGSSCRHAFLISAAMSRITLSRPETNLVVLSHASRMYSGASSASRKRAPLDQGRLRSLAALLIGPPSIQVARSSRRPRQRVRSAYGGSTPGICLCHGAELRSLITSSGQHQR